MYVARALYFKAQTYNLVLERHIQKIIREQDSVKGAEIQPNELPLQSWM